MSSVKQGTLTPPPEWAKHLRRWGKRIFWRRERGAEKRDAKERVREMEK